MKSGITKLLFLVFFLTIALSASAQSSAGGSSNVLFVSLAVIAGIIFLGVILQVADNLMRIEAKETGADKSGNNYSIFPQFSEMFSPDKPSFIGDGTYTVLKKGHDILLEGEAAKSLDAEIKGNTFAIQPPNFVGMSPIPKVIPAIGDEVKAGDPIFFDKKRPEIQYVAPVSGEVISIDRGAKRSIAQVVILADKELKYRSLPAFDLENGSREDLVKHLLDTGGWPLIRQRPFDLVPAPGDLPKAIFISTFDTAPLAPDLDFVIEGKGAAFQKGLDVLNKLTEGTVHLGLNANGEKPNAAFVEAKGVQHNWFHGAHPSGNVGVQIHHTDPINASDKVWVLGVQEVITLGKIFSENRYDASRVVALAGAEFKAPRYLNTYQGVKISDLVKEEVIGENVRLVSGDLLSGHKKAEDGFLDFYADQVTSIEEGDYYEMFGWLVPTTSRPSISKTYPTNVIFKDAKFKANTNTHGEKRAFVVTGQYESVLPMDIYPQHLMKAILANDFERMEGLGLYELSEEDLALCEFVCTSKQPLQSLLREGLETMRLQS